MEQEIIEGNKLIAEFMGMERTEKETGETTYKQDNNAIIWASQLLYNSSFDWLMPVVEKIDELNFEVTIQRDGTTISEYTANGNWVDRFDYDEGKTRIENTYHAVISFIKWYNSTK